MNRILRALLPLLALVSTLCPAAAAGQEGFVEAKRLAAEAASALGEGDPASAIELADSALSRYERYVPAVRVLVEAQIAAGHLDEARHSLRMWAPRTPDGELQGEFRALFERAARALIESHERLAAAEADVDVARDHHEQAAQLALELGDLHGALAIYSGVISSDEDPELLTRARIYELLGQSELALADCRRYFAGGGVYFQAARGFVALSHAQSTDQQLRADLALALEFLPSAERTWLDSRRGSAPALPREALDEYARILRYQPELPSEELEPAWAAELVAVEELGGIKIGPVSFCDWARSVAEFGVAALERGDLAAAQERFEVARAACPENSPPEQLASLIAAGVRASDLERALAAAHGLVTLSGSQGAHLARAQIHDLLGHFEAAVADYRAGLTGTPATNRDWLLLLDLLRKHGDFAGIVADCSRALAAAPEDQLALAWLSQSLVALGDKQHAVAVLGEALARSPDSVKLRVLYLETLGRTGDYERMQAEGLATTSERSDGCVDFALLLAREAIASGRTEELLAAAKGESLSKPLVRLMICFLTDVLSDAEAEFEMLRVRLVGDPSFLCFEAAAATRRGVRVEALEHLARVRGGAIDAVWAELIAAEVPKHDRFWTDGRGAALELLQFLARACPDSAVVAAHLAERSTFYLAELEAGLRRERELAGRRQRAQSLYDEAVAADRRGERAQAASGYAQALESDPLHSRAAMRLAVHHLVAGNGVAARETVRAAEVTPLIERFFVRGDSLSDRETMMLAEEAREMLDKFPRHAGTWEWNDALLAVVELYAKFGDGRQQGELLAELRIDPSDVVALEKRARAAWDEGRARIALADARRCVELRPDDPELRLLLSQVHWSCGEEEQSEAILDAAIERMPSSARLLGERARRRFFDYERGADSSKARAALEDARRAVALGAGRDTVAIQAHAHDALGEWEQAYDCVERMHQLDPNAWLPQFSRSATLRAQNFEHLVSAAAERGRLQYEQRVAEEAKQQAEAEEARYAAWWAAWSAQEQSEAEMAAQALQRIMTSGSMWGDSAFNDLVRSNWAAGAALDRRMAEDAARNSRVHEIERRFGYNSRAAEWERGQR